MKADRFLNAMQNSRCRSLKQSCGRDIRRALIEVLDDGERVMEDIREGTHDEDPKVSLWGFLNRIRLKFKHILSIMGIAQHQHINRHVEEELDVLHEIGEIIVIVRTVESFVERGNLPPVEDLRNFIRVTRRVEELLGPELRPRLVSGSLAILQFLVIPVFCLKLFEAVQLDSLMILWNVQFS